MSNWRTTRKAAGYKISFAATCFILLVALTGCATLTEPEEPSGLYSGQITVFLNGPENAKLDITFNLSAVKIMADDGTSREIRSAPIRINSIESKGRQMLLGERPLPEGGYRELILAVSRASIKRKETMADLAVDSGVIRIPLDITVSHNRNTSLFLSWNSDASIVDGYRFSPLITVRGQSPELSSLLVYVTNEDSNNVSVINRQTGTVVATIMVGRKPRGIATSSGKDLMKVYVANSGSDSISVIDPTTNTIENEIPVRFGREPVGIAVGRVAGGNELVFVSNYRSNNVSVIDASTFQEIEKIEVGNGPVAVAVDPPVESLTGTRFLSHDDISLLRTYREKYLNVYVVNKNYKSLSLLKMDLFSGRCEEVISLDVEWDPVALSVDYQRGKVYVANHGFNNISVIDIPEIVKGNYSGSVSSISNVGNYGTGVVADPAFDRIYFLRESPGEIVVIRPFFGSFDSLRTALPSIIGTIPVGNSPGALILDPEGRKIYVANSGSNNISVIDKTTRKVDRVIPVGRHPYGIAMFPYQP